MENNDIQKFIDDLYKIDPSLRSHESELRKTVASILKSKPDALADESFREELRAKLLKISDEKNVKRSTFRPWMFATATAGIGMIAIAIMVAKPDGQVTPSTGSSIAVLSPGAFGDLSTAGAAGKAAPGLGSADAISARPQGGGGGGGVGVPAPVTNGESVKMIAPGEWHPVYVKYSYKGEPLTLDASAVDVYRRARYARPATPASLLTVSGLPLDLSQFSGRLDNYSMSEDKDFGYTVFVNTVEGSVSISQNWLRWPHPENLCRDEACYQQYRLTPESIPSDAEAIQIADRFLQDYGVDRTGFGMPVVQNNDWQIAYAKAEDKRYAYVPESIPVVYPVLVDGLPTYDEGGNVAGLYVSVNSRHRKVDNLAGLAASAFEKSSYPALTSSDEILGIVERGGIYGPTSYEPNAEVVEATVGTPEKVLLRVYAPAADGIAQELFVPALRFPVTSTTDRTDIYVPKSIVVPLAESLAKPPGFTGTTGFERLRIDPEKMKVEPAAAQ